MRLCGHNDMRYSINSLEYNFKKSESARARTHTNTHKQKEHKNNRSYVPPNRLEMTEEIMGGRMKCCFDWRRFLRLVLNQ